jgi:hypothetical protein
MGSLVFDKFDKAFLADLLEKVGPVGVELVVAWVRNGLNRDTTATVLKSHSGLLLEILVGIISKLDASALFGAKLGLKVE